VVASLPFNFTTPFEKSSLVLIYVCVHARMVVFGRVMDTDS